MRWNIIFHFLARRTLVGAGVWQLLHQTLGNFSVIDLRSGTFVLLGDFMSVTATGLHRLLTRQAPDNRREPELPNGHPLGLAALTRR